MILLEIQLCNFVEVNITFEMGKKTNFCLAKTESSKPKKMQHAEARLDEQKSVFQLF